MVEVKIYSSFQFTIVIERDLSESIVTVGIQHFFIYSMGGPML